MLPQVSIAEPADAARIAEIHLAAFGPNVMLRAQFPSVEARLGLQQSLERKALADMRSSNVTVLVARRCSGRKVYDEDGKVSQLPAEAANLFAPPERGDIIGFAKYEYTSDGEEDHDALDRDWPAGTDVAVLEEWVRIAEEAHKTAMGDVPCFHLTFIGTHPEHIGQGAGSTMLQWGIEQSEKTGHPIYLEPTMDAVSFYAKREFRTVVRMSMDVSGKGDLEGVQVYGEAGMVYNPQKSDMLKKKDHD